MTQMTLDEARPKKMTALEKGIALLMAARRPLSLFEFNLIGVSESALGARLRESTQRGRTICRFRKGENYKEWTLTEFGWPVDGV